MPSPANYWKRRKEILKQYITRSVFTKQPENP